jgi:hypothetical protein
MKANHLSRVHRAAVHAASAWASRWLLPLAIVASLLRAAPVEAETGSWSTPVSISQDGTATKGSWFPSIAADNFGNVHVVWNAEFPDTKVTADDQQAHLDLAAAEHGATGESGLMAQLAGLFYARSENGSAWTKPVDVGLAWWGTAMRSSIAVDLAGRLHLIRLGMGQVTSTVGDTWNISQMFDDRDLWFTEAVGTQANQIHAWSAPVLLSRYAVGYYSDLAIDSKGVTHAILMEADNGNWGLYYTRSADDGKTWSDPVPLDPDQPVWWYRASMKVDAQGRIHVAWEVLDNTGSYGNVTAMKYAISIDGGQTWKTTVFTPAAGATSAPQQPTIGVDGNGTILLIDREPADQRIYYRTSTDGVSWSAPKPIPGLRVGVARPYDKYDTATDSAGHVHLVAVGYPGTATDMALTHLEWDGRAWSDPQIIASAPNYPEYPRIAVGDGNKLHVVWFDGDKASIDRTPVGGIYYSTAQTNAPSAAEPLSAMATALPATPTVVANEPSQSNSQVVSEPTVAPMPENVPPPVRTTDLPVVLSIAPVLVLLVVVTLVSLRAARLVRLPPWQS